MTYGIELQRGRKITEQLLSWYDENKRDLPWRHTQNPYSIWISEIMAQQTRISFLLAYYKRFIERFPTVDALASASEEEVFKVWEGLGYYSRARNLKKAAQMVVFEFDGAVPNTKEKLIQLPGIGAYTAGAILSIAYNLPIPAVDGNVLRVFSRVENSEEDITLPATRDQAAEFVAAVMSPTRAGCFTQALMELGALVCVPKNPRCIECPLSSLCLAYQAGTQTDLPKKTPKKPQKKQNKTVIIIRDAEGKILMRKRTEKLLSGLWEFYVTDAELTEDMVSNYIQKLGFSVNRTENIGIAKHVFTHIIWQMQGYECHVDSEKLVEGYVWMPQEDFPNLAMPVAYRFFSDQVKPL